MPEIYAHKIKKQSILFHTYELVFPLSITPLDSFGAVVIYGEFPNGEGRCDKGTIIYPIDDTYYNNIDRVREYAEQRDIAYMGRTATER